MSNQYYSQYYPSNNIQNQSSEHVYHQHVSADNANQLYNSGLIPANESSPQTHSYSYPDQSIPVVHHSGLIPASPQYSQAPLSYHAGSPVSSNSNRQSGIFKPLGDIQSGKGSVNHFEASDFNRNTFNEAGSTTTGRDDVENRKRTIGKICGLPWWLVVGFIVAVITCVAVGLGVGLGLGLKKSNYSSSSNSSAGNPSYLSKTGVWNGSSIALGSNPFADGNGQIELFFQHHTGDIRWMTGEDDGSFSGGGAVNVIATNAKNGTPISVVVEVVNGISTWHLVYLDSKNTFRELTRTSDESTWSNSSLSSLNIQPLKDSNAAFALCDNAYMRNPSTGFSRGLTLLYASDAHTIQQVDWLYGSTDWTPSGNFTANGRSACNCYNWNNNSSVHYYMYFDLDDSFKVMYRDYNTDSSDTSSGWTNVTSFSGIQNLNPATQIAFNGEYLIMQQPDFSLVGYNITFDEQETIGLQSTFSFEEPLQNGSHIWLWELPTKSGDKQLTVLGQVNGSDITALSRDMVTGQVGEQTLPVPDA